LDFVAATNMSVITFEDLEESPFEDLDRTDDHAPGPGVGTSVWL
jgi:hypothetical protein